MQFDANGHSYPGHPPDHMAILLGHVIGQSRTLGRIETRLEHGDRFHQEVRSDLTEIKGRLHIVERRRLLTSTLAILRSLKALAIAVAPIKEWAVGAAIVVLAIKGIVSPAELKAALLSAVSLK